MLIKLLGHLSLFRLDSKEQAKVKIHPHDKQCLLVPAGEVISLKDGEPLEGTEIQPNQTVLIKPGAMLRPHKFKTIVSYSSELARLGGQITLLTPVVQPNEGEKIGIVLRAGKRIDLADIPFVFELYMID